MAESGRVWSFIKAQLGTRLAVLRTSLHARLAQVCVVPWRETSRGWYLRFVYAFQMLVRLALSWSERGRAGSGHVRMRVESMDRTACGPGSLKVWGRLLGTGTLPAAPWVPLCLLWRPDHLPQATDSPPAARKRTWQTLFLPPSMVPGTCKVHAEFPSGDGVTVVPDCPAFQQRSLIT